MISTTDTTGTPNLSESISVLWVVSECDSNIVPMFLDDSMDSVCMVKSTKTNVDASS